MHELRLGGFAPFSTVDFPGRLAAVLFCQGCPWRCRYCQNPGLQPRKPGSAPVWSGVRRFLESRVGLLDSVVFSGGEPILQAALAPALREVRELGFRVGLHTSGLQPVRLSRLLPLVDWIGLDIKALPEDYPGITGVRGSGEAAWKSLDHVLEAGTDHEVRTTYHPGLFPASRLRDMCHLIAGKGVRCFALQECRPEGSARSSPPCEAKLSGSFVREVGALFERFRLR